MSYRGFLLLPALALFQASPVPADNKYLTPKDVPRHAFIVGVKSYEFPKVFEPLLSPVLDADRVSTLLNSKGYRTVTLPDANRSQIINGFKAFMTEVSSGDLVVVYLSGHGFSFGGYNYIVPKNSNTTEEADVIVQNVPLTYFLQKMEAASIGSGIIFFDACRAELSLKRGSKGEDSVAGPTGVFTTPSGLLVAFASGRGKLAGDGPTDGSLSVYTSALVNHMIEPEGVEVETMLKRVRNEVLRQTNFDQRPWEETSLIGEFHLVMTDEIRSEYAELWGKTLELAQSQAVQCYVDSFPESQFVSSAKRWLTDNPPMNDQPLLQFSCQNRTAVARVVGSTIDVYGTSDLAGEAIGTLALGDEVRVLGLVGDAAEIRDSHGRYTFVPQTVLPAYIAVDPRGMATLLTESRTAIAIGESINDVSFLSSIQNAIKTQENPNYLLSAMVGASDSDGYNLRQAYGGLLDAALFLQRNSAVHGHSLLQLEVRDLDDVRVITKSLEAENARMRLYNVDIDRKIL